MVTHQCALEAHTPPPPPPNKQGHRKGLSKPQCCGNAITRALSGCTSVAKQGRYSSCMMAQCRVASAPSLDWMPPMMGNAAQHKHNSLATRRAGELPVVVVVQQEQVSPGGLGLLHPSHTATRPLPNEYIIIRLILSGALLCWGRFRTLVCNSLDTGVQLTHSHMHTHNTTDWHQEDQYI